MVKVPGGAIGEALSEGAAVVGALPFRLARKVQYVEVRSVDAMSLHLRDGRLVKWGSAGSRPVDKAEVLDALLTKQSRPGVRRVRPRDSPTAQPLTPFPGMVRDDPAPLADPTRGGIVGEHRIWGRGAACLHGLPVGSPYCSARRRG